MRRILGIDPGSRITGYGIIESVAGQRAPRCLAGGIVCLRNKAMPEKFAVLFFELQEIVKTFQPTEMAIEHVFVNKNPRSALMLGQARGVAIAAVAAHGLPVFEYAPRQIKQAIVGKGSADKQQMQNMIQILLALSEKPGQDAADALAIALCHYHTTSSTLPGAERLPSRARRSSSTRKAQWKSYDRTASRKTD